MSDVIRLAIPARREALAVLRIMAGNAARLSGFGYNRVEEARLAVNEAASLLVADGRSSTLRCTLTGDGTSLEVEIVADPGPAVWPPAGWEDSLEHAVLSTVSDWYELGIGDDTRVRILLGQNGS
ncbi:MAG: ATP-binding protein [Acidimicrobiia bacterium]